MASPSLIHPPLLDQLFTGKIRLKLLARLLLNPSSQVYLRQLQKDLNVSSNTVRLELNKLSEMKPRGFTLKQIHGKSYSEPAEVQTGFAEVGVFQFLADGNSDVDVSY